MDKNTFAEKVLQGEETLYRIAKSMLFQDMDCEDAVQEAIIKAYQKRHTLRDERFFQTWLVRILINQCYTMKRKEKPQVPFEEHMENQAAEIKEDYSELYRAICQLPEKIRITVLLYYIEGYKMDEIKTILRIPQGTVKSRLNKGRKLLKITLTKEICRNEGVLQ